MNERIKELALELVTQCDWDPPSDPEYYTFAAEDLEKFAESIIKECANICNDVGIALFAEPVQKNLGTAQTCKIAIEKHFGIEE